MSIKLKKIRRSNRTRFKLRKSGNLRLSLFRSSKFIYAQLIDDSSSKTIISSSSNQKQFKDIKCKPKEMAFKIGEDIGAKISDKQLKNKISLDRGSYLFHGRIKEFTLGVKSKGVNI